MAGEQGGREEKKGGRRAWEDVDVEDVEVDVEK